ELSEPAQFIATRYGLTPTILAPMLQTAAIRASASSGSQIVAETVFPAIKRHYPEIAKDRSAIVIAFTQEPWRLHSERPHEFSYEDSQIAIVSTEQLNPVTYAEAADKDLCLSRLHKVLARDIGLLFYHLPKVEKPANVMSEAMLCVHDLDRMSE